MKVLKFLGIQPNVKMPLSKAFKSITKFVPYMSHEKSIRESGVIMGWIYVYIWHASKIGQKIKLTFFNSIYRRFRINNDFWLVRIFFWSVFTGIFSVNSRILIYDPNLDFVALFHFISGFISHLKTQKLDSKSFLVNWPWKSSH